ncbi:hypothetical protein C5610_04370 [Idiomarina sp. OT37-5b]|jgi:hypothetical protein|uniref:hypothetical protein n=1 Tax=Idiomarina sp. OT37-5b TaxID=2100422 RepID=UPI000CFA48C1|nr:hypothetical protein [Idiomarina sp. OT37-5b]AVJ55606.1 hypothetical protein C5610_04370 [Idiomarina sp. OT37-5b]
MRYQTGQATVEWLLVGLALSTILWLSERQLNLTEQLREWGVRVIEHYHFIFNYIGLAPGSGL